MKYLGNRWTCLRQVHTEDVFCPSLGQIWISRSKVKSQGHHRQKRHFSAFSSACVLFMFGKTSLACSSFFVFPMFIRLNKYPSVCSLLPHDTCGLHSDVRFHEILSAWKFQWNIAWKFHENFKKISIRRISHKRHELKYVNCLLSIMCLCQYSYDDFPLTVHINCDWQCLCK